MIADSKNSNLNEGFFVQFGYGASFKPAQEVVLPLNVSKAVGLIQQLGFLKEGEAHLFIESRTRGKEKKDFYSVRLGELQLFSFSVYAKQIVNIEYDHDTFTPDEFVKKMFMEAKQGLVTGKLNKTSLGRFTTLRLADVNKTYTLPEIAEFALSGMETQTIIGMMKQELSKEAIMGFDELPDSWLQEILDRFN